MDTSRVSGPKPPAARRQDQIVLHASSHACVSCYTPVQLPSCPMDEEVLDHLLPQTLLLYYSCHRHLCSDIARSPNEPKSGASVGRYTFLIK
jgi:hypothetical protein